MHEHASHRLKSAAERFSNGLNVRRDPDFRLLPGMRRPRAADSTHDFVKDEKGAALLANLFHSGEVSLYGADAPERLDGFVTSLVNPVSRSLVTLRNIGSRLTAPTHGSATKAATMSMSFPS